jgi:hypothetical protein
LHGLNLCLGKPFTREEIRSMMAYNYVEGNAVDKDLVCFGYETTMTATGTHSGGFFAIHEGLSVMTTDTAAFSSPDGQPFPLSLFSPSPDSIKDAGECPAEDACNDTVKVQFIPAADVSEAQLLGSAH